MKRYTWITILLIALATTAMAQPNKSLKIGQNDVDLYIGINGESTSILSNNEVFADFKVGMTFNDKWTLGLIGSAMGHNTQGATLVDDGTYHLYVMFGGLYVERSFRLTPRFKIAGSLMSGQGLTYYQYDKEYRPDKVWSEEIIDRTTFGVQEAALAVRYRVAPRLWLGVIGSITNTSPIEMIDTPTDLLKNANAGLNIEYEIY